MSLERKNFVKLIVVGSAAVGKSCILFQFTDGEFTEDTAVTVGVEFGISNMLINGENYKIQIWDTAGQESFKAITRNYYRGTHGAMLCYDITKASSFQYLQGWVDEIYSQAGKTQKELIILIIGNKCDNDEKREISYEQGKKFAEDRNLLFFETSAKTGFNVELAFRTLISNIVESIDLNSIDEFSSENIKNNLIKPQNISLKNIETTKDEKETKKPCCNS